MVFTECDADRVGDRGYHLGKRQAVMPRLKNGYGSRAEVHHCNQAVTRLDATGVSVAPPAPFVDNVWSSLPLGL